MLLDPFNASKKAFEILASQGRDEINRSITQEKKVGSNLVEESVQKIADSNGRFDQIDLVDDDDAGFVILLNQSGDLLVLGRDSFGCVDNQGANIGPDNALFRTHHAENFDGRIVFAPRSNPRGVDQYVIFS